MRKTILAIGCAALVAGTAFAEELVTTTSTGTIHQFVPGETIVVKESSGPMTYRYSDGVTYVTKSGKTLPLETARTYLRVGRPVTVHYGLEDDTRVVKKIEFDDDGDREVEIDSDEDD